VRLLTRRECLGPESHPDPPTHLEALVELDEILVAAEFDHVRAFEKSEHPANELRSDAALLILG